MKNCYNCVYNGKKHKTCITCKQASNYEKSMRYSFSLDSLDANARANYEKMFSEFVTEMEARDMFVALFAYLYSLSSRDKVIAINWLGEGCKITRKLRRELGASYLFIQSTLKRIKIVEFITELSKSTK